MVCSNCRQANPPGSIFCKNCRLALNAASPANSSSASPFDDYLPGWMQPQSAQNSKAATPSANLGVSIEDLLKATELSTFSTASNLPTAVASPSNASALPLPPPPPDFSSRNLNTRPGFPSNFNSSFASPAFSPSAAPQKDLPFPTFEEPPLWSKPASPKSTWNERSAPNTGNTSFNSSFSTFSTVAAAPESSPTTAKYETPGYGVERGFYFYTNDEGELVLHELAGWFGRVFATLIDAVIVAIILFIFNNTIGNYLLGVLSQNGADARALRQASQSGDVQAFGDAFSHYVTFASIATGLLSTTISLLYYSSLVMLRGNTLGQSIMGIRVVGTTGPVRLYGSFIRALYGAVPGIVWLFLIPDIIGGFVGALFASLASGSSDSGLSALSDLLFRALGPLLAIIILYILVVVGFVWALFDKNHQGWHDKLARTYVVRKQPAQ